MNSERRASRRESIPSLVYLDLQPNNGGILLDLNANGMQVSVAHPLTAAKRVRFSFGLSPPAKIEGIGRIAWISESGKSAGICFEDLPESSLSQISQWLQSESSTIVREPNEPRPSSTRALEIQIETREPKPKDPGRVRVATSKFKKIRTPSFPEGPEESRQRVTGGSPTASEPGEPDVSGAVPRKEVIPRPQPEWATEASAPLLASGAGGTGQAAGTGKITVAQKPVVGEWGWIPSCAAETVPTIFEEKPSSIIEPWQPVVELSWEPTLVESEAFPSATGLNDRLPVYTLPINSPCPNSAPILTLQVIFDAMREIGWGLERDWHVGLGALLLVSGFAALWQRPPLLFLAIALWIASALVVTNRKEPPEDWKQPGDTRHGRNRSTREKRTEAGISRDVPAKVENGPIKTDRSWAGRRTPVSGVQ